VVTPVLNGKLTAKGIMKNHLVAVLVLTLFAAFNSQLSTAFAQGSLTPSGAPAPTMKTLAQIEPRTPVDAAHTPVDAAHTPGDISDQFIINQPGSYYLTANIAGVSDEYGIGILTNSISPAHTITALSVASIRRSPQLRLTPTPCLPQSASIRTT
jgi:hypothetical protein